MSNKNNELNLFGNKVPAYYIYYVQFKKFDAGTEQCDYNENVNKRKSK